jgi:hypothetical protein
MAMKSRRRLLAAAVAAVALGAPAASQACTTSWSSAVSGNWNDPARWSAGVPGGGSDACITVAGTYTVTLSASVSVNSLTLGGASGTQTLLEQAGGAAGSIGLGIGGGGGSIGTNGVLTLATSDTSYVLVDSGGAAVANAGTLNLGTTGGGSGIVYLRSPITNSGTTNVNSAAATVDFGSRTFTNQGTFNVAASGAISFGGSGLVNSSGTIANSGTLRITSSFTQGNGTNTGTPPVVSGGVNYTGTGASTILAVSSGTVSGNLAAGQTLRIQGGGGYGPAAWGAAGSFTNAGTISLQTTDTNYSLLDSGGTPNVLTNSGTLNLGGGGGTGIIYLRTPVTNTGTTNVISASATVDFGNRTFTNQGGTFNVAAGGAIGFGGSGLVNQSGTVANSGTLRVTTTYTQGNGTNTGTLPVISGAIAYTGTGASTLLAVGSGTISGNIAAGQTLRILGDGAYGNAAWGAAAPFTNAGTISLQTSDTSYSLLDTGGTPNVLTNSGTLNLGGGGGTGIIYLRTPVTNTGTTNVISASATVDFGNRTFTNQGTVNVNAGAAINFGGSGLVNSSGTIANSGTLRITTGYTQGNGALTGTPPQVSGTIAYTGNGAGTVSAVGSGTVSGSIAATQTLIVQGGGFGTANWTASSLVNAGTITEQTSDGGYALIDGSLTNNGVLQGAAGGGSGTLYLRANITNNKTIRLGAGSTLYSDAGTITQGKKATVETQIASATSFGVLNKVGGALALKGTLLTTALGGYKAAVGASFPVITGGAVTGTFDKLSKAIIDKKTGRYYRPVYGSGVTLAVSNATVAVSPGSGAAGSAITITGSGWIAGAKVTITFKAHDGTKFTLGNATANASGAISFPTTVPAGAAAGSAQITGKDAIAKVTSAVATYSVS